MKNSYRFFCNTDCKYYPCHDLKDINCLFCYCPLYTYDCGGNFVITKGKKDCTNCTIPHIDYDYVIEFLKTIK